MHLAYVFYRSNVMNAVKCLVYLNALCNACTLDLVLDDFSLLLVSLPSDKRELLLELPGHLRSLASRCRRLDGGDYVRLGCERHVSKL